MATTKQYDEVLTALALVEAYVDRDEDSIDELLDGEDAAPVVSHLLTITHRLLKFIASVTEADVLMPIEMFRRKTMEQIAEKGLDS